jgi:hypothetical protein
MISYRVEADNTGFRVVELLPGGEDGHALCGFLTPEGATEWMESYLRMMFDSFQLP